MNSLCYLVMVAALTAASAASQPLKRELCPDLVTTLAPQLVFKQPLDRLRRVEIRLCRPGLSENLQIAAWEDGSVTPSLLFETDDHTLVQLFMRGKICVIESARDAYDTVTVIEYEKGKPRIVLQETVRDPATITTTLNEVKVTLTPDRGATKSYSFNGDH